MVISFEYGGQLVTHRVINVRGTLLNTKGDNNATMDPWEINISDVKGVPLLRIPYLGSFLLFLRRPAGLFLLILIPAMAILIDEVRKVIKLIQQRNESLSE
jgi:signal peptidase